MVYELKNEKLTVQFSDQGAEMLSLKSNQTGQEYLWQGDSKYWGRRSPILFPVVGRLIQDRYVYEGKEYPMSQHGFARDLEFEMISCQPESEIWFERKSDAETLQSARLK